LRALKSGHAMALDQACGQWVQDFVDKMVNGYMDLNEDFADRTLLLATHTITFLVIVLCLRISLL
jgi:hypothetical protein